MAVVGLPDSRHRRLVPNLPALDTIAMAFVMNKRRPHSRYRSANKYQNTPCVIDGHRFPSKREATRYLELRLLADTGKITDLKLQVAFPLYGPDGQTLKSRKGRALKYIADFVYTQDGVQVIEDAKGVQTETYKLKRSIMEANGYQIREV